MEYRLSLSADIATKSASVRRHMGRCLATNLRNALRRQEPKTKVVAQWDHLVVRLPRELSRGDRLALEASMTRIPGVQRVARTRNRPLGDWRNTIEQLARERASELEGKRFKVKVKRKGHHDFGSVEVERALGAALLAHAADARVDLSTPEVVMPLRIDGDTLIEEVDLGPGLGGFPLGTQGEALVLMSGGYDSPVAAYRMLRRGIKCHFVLFRFGGQEQESAVKALTRDLWQRYSASHKANFITVPFEEVVETLRREVPDGLVSLVLKRLMIEAAARVAQRARIPALVTGEAIAQVSSQTLTNLGLIDRASHLPVLRPLLTDDKQTIIDEAHRIATAEASSRMPEYCGGMSSRPRVKAPLKELQAAEARLPADLLDRALASATRQPVDAPVSKGVSAPSQEPLAKVSFGGLHDFARTATRVIDVRPPDDVERRPLGPLACPVDHIPFYELATRSDALDPDTRYLLYCDQGVMSRLQALHLKDRGLEHVGLLVASS
ncbi:tRNA 4-thiouridine(8) synthase ThiI [Halomonas sp. YLB-10]|uniref:tRNA uracil 4-sulfurtransferase ThiI n=1 Tax=Halomonas sp. YLB-10 TaxID=2483111 RepID=UPI000F5D8D2C|nr:tRNA uracil 4-sulfurtransferase ThiI [Halomonas sp. YLB-10]RQW69600.1 tRNA 4-thiouridine(8) synthase ThiI [Halomonas sp. YLB-10]